MNEKAPRPSLIRTRQYDRRRERCAADRLGAEPRADRVRDDHALPRVAERRARPRARRLPRALALVGRRARGVLGVDLGVLRRPRRASRTSASSRAARCPAPSGSRARGSATPSTSSATATTTRVAISHASELRPLDDWTWGELRARAGADRAGLRASRASRRATASSPTCRTSPRRSPRSSRCASDRRDLVELLAGLRRRAASSTASRRSSRRCCSRSTATATAARTSTAPTRSRELERELPTLERTLVAPVPRRRRMGAARRGARVRAAPVRPPALGPLLVRHDRPAEGDRPRPGRDPARAPQEAPPAPRRARRRPRLLVHDDRLDDVELPRRRAAHRGVDRPLRRQPGVPDLGTLWDLADAAGITCFGTSAGYIASCMKAGVEPRRRPRPLAPATASARPARRSRPRASAGCATSSAPTRGSSRRRGGTDVCTAFVGGVPTLPVYHGELQARALGAKVEAFDEDGRSLVGEVGELVITEPMPSMPLYLWGDDDGSRYRESYFATYPGVWRHGDWIEITERGTAIIYGRSDSTINRGGVRMGTSEIYRAVLALDEVVDALVVDVPREGDGSWHAAVRRAPRGRRRSTTRSSAEIKRRIREDCSPRHVPDEILAVAGDPAHALGQGPRGARQADPDRAPRRRRSRAATRSRTPRRSTGSRSLQTANFFGGSASEPVRDVMYISGKECARARESVSADLDRELHELDHPPTSGASSGLRGLLRVVRARYGPRRPSSARRRSSRPPAPSSSCLTAVARGVRRGTRIAPPPLSPHSVVLSAGRRAARPVRRPGRHAHPRARRPPPRVQRPERRACTGWRRRITCSGV